MFLKTLLLSNKVCGKNIFWHILFGERISFIYGVCLDILLDNFVHFIKHLFVEKRRRSFLMNVKINIHKNYTFKLVGEIPYIGNITAIRRMLFERLISLDIIGAQLWAPMKPP